MRRFLTSVVVAGLISGQAHAAECLRPGDHVALDVVALKTQLMVTALTCQADERYNAFVRKYQPDLQRENKTMDSYFMRSFGRAGSKQRDDYVTQLANSQSQTGLKQGSYFCQDNMSTFDEVMSLRSNAELTDYAAGRAGQQPISTIACPAGAERPAARTAARRRS